MHVASLVHIGPTTYHEFHNLYLENTKYFSLTIFSCAIYAPITSTQRTKMGPQQRLEIYVGFDSLSIIRYLEPLIGDVFIVRFVDCHFNESVFPPLEGEKLIPKE